LLTIGAINATAAEAATIDVNKARFMERPF
jgi:hypothetical protein